MTAQAFDPGSAGDPDGPRDHADHGDHGDGADLGDLDVAQTLAAAERAMVDKQAAEVRAIEVDLQFAVLHATDPQAGRAAPPTPAEAKANGWTVSEWERACDRLIQLGGDGTPMVAELPICELAVARRVHTMAARNHLADALDLGHRLPMFLAGLREGRGQVWVARKIAAMSRYLDRHQVRQVDQAVAAALDESPGRVLAIAEAAVLRADPDHARRQQDERARRRYVAFGRLDESGLRKVFALIDAGDAAWLAAILDRIADALADRPDLAGEGWSREELRAEALGWLAHPEDVLALLAGRYPIRTDHPDAETPNETSSPAVRQRAVLHVHLSHAALQAALNDEPGAAGVARVEELGPVLLDQVRRLLGHARVDLTPVVDLNVNRSVNGYEHPPDVKERGFLRACGEVFPHAQSQSRRVDGDHPRPYEPNGPPGQTGDHNHAPLGRRHHRAKTHLPYQLIQLSLGEYVWRTPHGLYRLVDGTGTHVIDEATAWALVGRTPPA